MLPDPNHFLAWWQDPDYVGLAQVVLSAFSLVLAVLAATGAGYIAWRQKQMQEEQHTFFKDQLLQRAEPEMFIWSLGTPLNEFSKHDVLVRNRGTKALRTFRWEVTIPEKYNKHDYVQLQIKGGEKASEAIAEGPEDDAEDYRRHYGYWDKGVFPKRHAVVGYVLIHKTVKAPRLKWTIDCEDGIFPPQPEEDDREYDVMHYQYDPS